MRLLLHTCCATCLAGVIPQLKEYNLTCFFYNPNIHPRQEYERRLKDTKKHCDKLNIPLIQGSYNKDKWHKIVGEDCHPRLQDTEGGQRCVKCYTMRLEQTAVKCRRGLPSSPTGASSRFATTLTLSPHKKAEIINQIGQELAAKYKVKFLSADFKKHNGFKHACKISKQQGFYRQNYCGCVYSRL